MERKRLERAGWKRLFFVKVKLKKHYNFTVTPAVAFKAAMCGGGRKADSARFAC